jgi:hypothetical protein
MLHYRLTRDGSLMHKGKLAGKDAAVAVVAPVTIIYRGKMLGEVLAK